MPIIVSIVCGLGLGLIVAIVLQYMMCYLNLTCKVSTEQEIPESELEPSTEQETQFNEII